MKASFSSSKKQQLNQCVYDKSELEIGVFALFAFIEESSIKT